MAQKLRGRKIIGEMTCAVSQLRHKPQPASRVKNTTVFGSQNWSGFQTTKTTKFYTAAMEWEIPSVTAQQPCKTSGCPKTGPASRISIWPGVGAGTSSKDQLVQAGSEQRAEINCPLTGGCMQVNLGPYMWYEQFPRENEVQVKNILVKAGDLVNVDVYISGATSYFQMCNLTTNTCITPAQDLPTSSYKGAQAEWIAERPSLDCGLTPLLRYSTKYAGASRLIVDAAQAGGSDYKLHPIGSYGPVGVNMYDDFAETKLLSEASALSSDGMTFNTIWRGYGTGCQ